MTKDYEYDVAFSFHSADEELATQLNDLLQDRFKTFLYSKRQEVLAGSDGEQSFNAVFAEKARCVVIFCRKEWGETPFTRIEQTAIRNRAFSEGYEFTIFVPTDNPPTIPPWLPKTRLYFGLSRFGLQGLVGVVEKRIQELGGEPTIESIQERAGRLQRARDLKAIQARFRNSEDGVRNANAAFARMTEALQARASEIAATNKSLANLKVRNIQDYWLISGVNVCIVFSWNVRFRNSLDESVLRAETYKGVPRLPGLIPGMGKPQQLSTREFDYELARTGHHGFLERTAHRRLFSAEELADHLLRVYMDAAEQHESH